MKDFFDMTRQERRGTIVLLALIALILLSTVFVRSCKADAPTGMVDTALVRFETEIDSARYHVREPSPTKKPHVNKHKSKKPKPSPHRSKPAPEPRRMDPVPRF